MCRGKKSSRLAGASTFLARGPLCRLVSARRSCTNGECTGTYDGKDYPAPGSPDFDAQAVKASNPFRATITLKKAGKVVGSGTRVISRDGKVMTIRLKLTNAKGQTFNSVRVFEKR